MTDIQHAVVGTGLRFVEYNGTARMHGGTSNFASIPIRQQPTLNHTACIMGSDA